MALDVWLVRPVESFSTVSGFDYGTAAVLAHALLDAGALAVTARRDAGPSALDSVARSGDAALFARLLAAGADPSPRPIAAFSGSSTDTITWLQLACERGHAEIIDLALQAGIDVESRTPNKCACTALQSATMYAANAGAERACATIAVLLRGGAKVNVSSGLGTAMDIAMGIGPDTGNPRAPREVVTLLRAHGAKTSRELGFIEPGAVFFSAEETALIEELIPGTLARVGRFATAAAPCRKCGVAPAAEIDGLFCVACE